MLIVNEEIMDDGTTYWSIYVFDSKAKKYDYETSMLFGRGHSTRDDAINAAERIRAAAVGGIKSYSIAERDEIRRRADEVLERTQKMIEEFDRKYGRTKGGGT